MIMCEAAREMIRRVGGHPERAHLLPVPVAHSKGNQLRNGFCGGTACGGFPQVPLPYLSNSHI